MVKKVGQLAKGPETKKAMPFVQGLRRRLVQQGESVGSVLERKLGFQETETLKEMVKNLKKQTGCSVVEVVAVDEGGKNGEVVVAEQGVGEKREGLPPVAEAAVPGTPSFHFENVEA
jgi:leucyl-tRNA synthetase